MARLRHEPDDLVPVSIEVVAALHIAPGRAVLAAGRAPSSLRGIASLGMIDRRPVRTEVAFVFALAPEAMNGIAGQRGLDPGPGQLLLGAGGGERRRQQESGREVRSCGLACHASAPRTARPYSAAARSSQFER